jgi:hypothetical protein
MRLPCCHLSVRVALFMIALASVLSAQSLQVIRADGTSATLTAAQIAAAPHVTVSVKDHDTPAEFEGVPLPPCLRWRVCKPAACVGRE